LLALNILCFSPISHLQFGQVDLSDFALVGNAVKGHGFPQGFLQRRLGEVHGRRRLGVRLGVVRQLNT
jgi:hypothetical protein